MISSVMKLYHMSVNKQLCETRSLLWLLYTIMQNIKVSQNTEKLFIIIHFAEKEFPNIVHSLDVWHKSKSIKKCLAKVCSLLLVYESAFSCDFFYVFWLVLLRSWVNLKGWKNSVIGLDILSSIFGTTPLFVE